MLNGNFFTPEYVINPADAGGQEAELDVVIATTNFSYAFLDIGFAPGTAADTEGPTTFAGNRQEWRETLNTQAIVLSDLNTGADAGALRSSVWTEEDSGDWRGGVVRNDNSTGFETDSTNFSQTKYGNNEANTTDDLFTANGTGEVAQANAAMEQQASGELSDHR